MINGKLDEVDCKMLNILQKDARINETKLGEKVHKSQSAVNERPNKMRDNGFIKGFAAILDREKIGKPVLVVTNVQLVQQTTCLLNEFEELVTAIEDVQFCLHVSGKWNFILLVCAVTPQDYFNFIMNNINSLPNVAHTESAFVMKEAKAYGPFNL